MRRESLSSAERSIDCQSFQLPKCDTRFRASWISSRYNANKRVISTVFHRAGREKPEEFCCSCTIHWKRRPAAAPWFCAVLPPPPECWIITPPQWTRRWSSKKWLAAVSVGGVFFVDCLFFWFPPRSVPHLFSLHYSLITSCYLWCYLTPRGCFLRF